MSVDQPVFIDVREPIEFAAGHVAGAINIPPTVLVQGSKALEELPKDAQIIVYCRTGSRSNVAKNILLNQGFTNVTNGINQGHVESRYLS